VSVPPAPPIVVASESPQRRAILEQLNLPFLVVPPQYEEHDSLDADPIALVREHAQGKARSVGPHEECPVLGVDTAVVVDGQSLGKPGSAAEAEAMLERLSGRIHEVVSGLCLVTPGWEELDHEVTRVTFRPLTARDLAHYIGSGEWKDRAGGYAIQGLGASLVERIEGDYLNVVGLPATLLVRLLTQHFPGTYGFG
jgi:septum formation protein